MSPFNPGLSGSLESDPADQAANLGKQPVQQVSSFDRAPSDVTLVGRITAGDQASFELLYHRYAAACLSLCRRIVVDPDFAQDAVQVAFLAVWEHADRFHPEHGSVRSWLFNITHHKAVDLVRSQERHHRRRAPQEWLTHAIATGVMPEDQAETTLQSRRAFAALGRLSEPQREVLMLCYYGGFTQIEVATRLDVPLGTVKTRCRTSLQLLRTALGTDPDEQQA